MDDMSIEDNIALNHRIAHCTMLCQLCNIKIIVVVNKTKNRIKPTPNEKNLTQDIPDNFKSYRPKCNGQVKLVTNQVSGELKL